MATPASGNVDGSTARIVGQAAATYPKPTAPMTAVVTTSERELLTAISNNPDDEALRGVYADWLEQHGDFDRAEMIRLLCRLNSPHWPGSIDDNLLRLLLIRVRELLLANGNHWLVTDWPWSQPPYESWVSLCRGLALPELAGHYPKPQQDDHAQTTLGESSATSLGEQLPEPDPAEISGWNLQEADSADPTTGSEDHVLEACVLDFAAEIETDQPSDLPSELADPTEDFLLEPTDSWLLLSDSESGVSATESTPPSPLSASEDSYLATPHQGRLEVTSLALSESLGVAGPNDDSPRGRAESLSDEVLLEPTDDFNLEELTLEELTLEELTLEELHLEELGLQEFEFEEPDLVLTLNDSLLESLPLENLSLEEPEQAVALLSALDPEQDAVVGSAMTITPDWYGSDWLGSGSPSSGWPGSGWPGSGWPSSGWERTGENDSGWASAEATQARRWRDGSASAATIRWVRALLEGQAKPLWNPEKLRRLVALFPNLHIPRRHRLEPSLASCPRTTAQAATLISEVLSVRKLCLTNCQLVSDEGVGELAPLFQLRTLELSQATGLTDAALAHLAGIWSLRRLALRGCPLLTDAGVARLGSLTALDSLELSSAVRLTDRAADHLAGLPKLAHLSLVGCNLLSDAALQVLGNMPLRVLSLGGCQQISDRGLEELSQAEQLQVLDLTHLYRLTARGLSCLRQLGNLESLNLTACLGINSSGVRYLAEIPNLRRLELVGCEWVNRRALAIFAQLPKLDALNLSDCLQVSDSALKTLAGSPMRILSLSHCRKITDSGLAFLAEVPNLQTLDISGCPRVTEAGLLHLAHAGNLRHLIVRGCNGLRLSGLNRLSQLRPDLWIAGPPHPTLQGIPL